MAIFWGSFFSLRSSLKRLSSGRISARRNRRIDAEGAGSSQLMKRGNLACGGGGTRCWFKFGNRGIDAEGAGIYGSQSKDDFGRDHVEQIISNMTPHLT